MKVSPKKQNKLTNRSGEKLSSEAMMSIVDTEPIEHSIDSKIQKQLNICVRYVI